MEININCDLGETSKFCSTENDPLLLGIVNSANIACGYHAGDKILVSFLFILKSSNGVLPIIFHPPGLSKVYIVQNFSTIPTDPLFIFTRGVSLSLIHI